VVLESSIALAESNGDWLRAITLFLWAGPCVAVPVPVSTAERDAPFTKGDRHRIEPHNAIHRKNLTRSQSPFVNSRMKYPA